MPSNFLFFGNGPYDNRGCEAIVRGTVEILRKSFGNDNRFTNAFFYASDGPPPKEHDPKIASIVLSYHGIRFPFDHASKETATFLDKCLEKLPRFLRTSSRMQMRWTRSLAREIFGPLVDRPACECDAALALGGDNYSFDYGFPRNHLLLNSAIKKANKPLVIWGASVGPFEGSRYKPYIFENFHKTVDLFFVREKKTLDYLTSNGLSSKTFYAADPAFVMQPEPLTPEQLGFVMPDAPLGINLSPLMAQYVCDKDIVKWTSLCREFLVLILRATDLKLLLIPHVMTEGELNNDYRFLKLLHENLVEEFPDRMFLVDDSLNAAQLKWVVSQCKYLIAARTHATIAAFSNFVPTLSLAYSTKAVGLNNDLFGHENYLLRPDRISPENILSTLSKIQTESDMIIDRLRNFQQENIHSAFSAGEILRDFLDKRG